MINFFRERRLLWNTSGPSDFRITESDLNPRWNRRERPKENPKEPKEAPKHSGAAPKENPKEAEPKGPAMTAAELPALVEQINKRVGAANEKLAQLPIQFRGQFKEKMCKWLNEHIPQLSQAALIKEVESVLKQFTAGLQDAQDKAKKEKVEHDRKIAALNEEMAKLEKAMKERINKENERASRLSEQRLTIEHLKEESNVTPEQVHNALEAYDKTFIEAQNTHQAIAEIVEGTGRVKEAFDAEMKGGVGNAASSAGLIAGGAAIGAAVGVWAFGIGALPGAAIGAGIGAAIHFCIRIGTHLVDQEKHKKMQDAANAVIQKAREEFATEKKKMTAKVGEMEDAGEVLNGVPETVLERERKAYEQRKTEIAGASFELTEGAQRVQKEQESVRKATAEIKEGIVKSRVAQTDIIMLDTQAREKKEAAVQAQEKIKEQMAQTGEQERKTKEQAAQQGGGGQPLELLTAIAAKQEKMKQALEATEKQEKAATQMSQELVKQDFQLREQGMKLGQADIQVAQASTELEIAQGSIEEGFVSIEHYEEQTEEAMEAGLMHVDDLRSTISENLFQKGLMMHTTNMNMEKLESNIPKDVEAPGWFAGAWVDTWGGFADAFKWLFKDTICNWLRPKKIGPDGKPTDEYVELPPVLNELAGFLSGVSRGIGSLGEGIGTMLAHPVDTMKGIGMLLGIDENGFLKNKKGEWSLETVGEAWAALGKGLIAWDTFAKGDSGSIAEGIGEVGFNVLLTIGTAGTGAAAKTGVSAAAAAAGLSARMATASFGGRILLGLRAVAMRPHVFLRHFVPAAASGIGSTIAAPFKAIGSAAAAVAKNPLLLITKPLGLGFGIARMPFDLAYGLLKGGKNLWEYMLASPAQRAAWRVARTEAKVAGTGARLAGIVEQAETLTVNGKKLSQCGKLEELALLTPEELAKRLGTTMDDLVKSPTAFREFMEARALLADHAKMLTELKALKQAHVAAELKAIDPALKLERAAGETMEQMAQRLGREVPAHPDKGYLILHATEEGMIAFDASGQLRYYKPGDIPGFVRQANGRMRILNMDDATRIKMGEYVIRHDPKLLEEIARRELGIKPRGKLTPEQEALVRRKMDELRPRQAQRAFDQRAYDAKIAAHEYGTAVDGRYSPRDLVEKRRILMEQGGFSQAEANALIENWITGHGAVATPPRGVGVPKPRPSQAARAGSTAEVPRASLGEVMAFEGKTIDVIYHTPSGPVRGKLEVVGRPRKVGNVELFEGNFRDPSGKISRGGTFEPGEMQILTGRNMPARAPTPGAALAPKGAPSLQPSQITEATLQPNTKVRVIRQNGMVEEWTVAGRTPDGRYKVVGKQVGSKFETRTLTLEEIRDAYRPGMKVGEVTEASALAAARRRYYNQNMPKRYQDVDAYCNRAVAEGLYPDAKAARQDLMRRTARKKFGIDLSDAALEDLWRVHKMEGTLGDLKLGGPQSIQMRAKARQAINSLYKERMAYYKANGYSLEDAQRLAMRDARAMTREFMDRGFLAEAGTKAKSGRKPPPVDKKTPFPNKDLDIDLVPGSKTTKTPSSPPPAPPPGPRNAPPGPRGKPPLTKDTLIPVILQDGTKTSVPYRHAKYKDMVRQYNDCVRNGRPVPEELERAMRVRQSRQMRNMDLDDLFDVRRRIYRNAKKRPGGKLTPHEQMYVDRLNREMRTPKRVMEGKLTNAESRLSELTDWGHGKAIGITFWRIGEWLNPLSYIPARWARWPKSIFGAGSNKVVSAAGEVAVRRFCLDNKIYKGFKPNPHPFLEPFEAGLGYGAKADGKFHVLGTNKHGTKIVGRWNRLEQRWDDVRIVRDKTAKLEARCKDLRAHGTSVDDLAELQALERQRVHLLLEEELGTNLRGMKCWKDGRPQRIFRRGESGQIEAWEVIGKDKHGNLYVSKWDPAKGVYSKPEQILTTSAEFTNRGVGLFSGKPGYNISFRHKQNHNFFKKLAADTNDDLFRSRQAFKDAQAKGPLTPVQQNLLECLEAEMRARGLIYDSPGVARNWWNRSKRTGTEIRIWDYADPAKALQQAGLKSGDTVFLVKNGRTVQCTVEVVGEELVFRTWGGKKDIVARAHPEQARCWSSPKGTNTFEVAENGFPRTVREKWRSVDYGNRGLTQHPPKKLDELWNAPGGGKSKFPDGCPVTFHGPDGKVTMYYHGSKGGKHFFTEKPCDFFGSSTSGGSGKVYQIPGREMEFWTGPVFENGRPIVHPKPTAGLKPTPKPKPAPAPGPTTPPPGPTTPPPAPGPTSKAAAALDGIAGDSWFAEMRACNAVGKANGQWFFTRWPQAIMAQADTFPILGFFLRRRHDIIYPLMKAPVRIVRNAFDFIFRKNTVKNAAIKEQPLVAELMRVMENQGLTHTNQYWLLRRRHAKLVSRGATPSVLPIEHVHLGEGVLESLHKAGQPVKVKVSGGGVVEGTLTSVSDTHVTIRTAGGVEQRLSRLALEPVSAATSSAASAATRLTPGLTGDPLIQSLRALKKTKQPVHLTVAGVGDVEAIVIKASKDGKNIIVQYTDSTGVVRTHPTDITSISVPAIP